MARAIPRRGADSWPLPEVVAHITEHQVRTRTCSECGVINRADAFAGVRASPLFCLISHRDVKKQQGRQMRLRRWFRLCRAWRRFPPRLNWKPCNRWPIFADSSDTRLRRAASAFLPSPSGRGAGGEGVRHGVAREKAPSPQPSPGELVIFCRTARKTPLKHQVFEGLLRVFGKKSQARREREQHTPSPQPSTGGRGR